MIFTVCNSNEIQYLSKQDLGTVKCIQYRPPVAFAVVRSKAVILFFFYLLFIVALMVSGSFVFIPYFVMQYLVS